MKKSIRYILCFFFLMAWHLTAHAARSFTQTLTSPSPAQFDMGSTSTGTWRVTNTNTAGNVGERIYQVRLRLNSGTTFSNTTAAPPGWTRSSFTTTSVFFQATSWANAIPVSGFVDFSAVMVIRTTTADVTDNLRDFRAYYTTTTTGPPFTQLGTVTHSAPTAWTDKSLIVTLTPSSTSVPKSCSSAFTLTMQVTNRSTVAITTVTSVPKPPTVNSLSGGASAATASAPPDFNLNSGATNSFVWTYTTGANPGTISFTASARDSSGTRTSRTITSPVITVTNTSCFVATFTAPPAGGACVFSGDTATFTMQVTNNSGVPLLNVQPSALTLGGTATIGAFTGPAPASIATLANGASGTFTWTAPVTGNVDNNYTVTGFATATGGFVTQSTTSDSTAMLRGYLLQVTPDPNASSINQEMNFNVTNHGCSSVNSVSIPVVGLLPAIWTWNGDSYSLVQTTLGNYVETGGAGGWTAAQVGSNVVFTAPGGSEMSVGVDGNFMLTYSTPNTAGTTTFNLTVTSTADPSKTISDTVTINPFDTATPNPNATSPGTWREQFP